MPLASYGLSRRQWRLVFECSHFYMSKKPPTYYSVFKGESPEDSPQKERKWYIQLLLMLLAIFLFLTSLELMIGGFKLAGINWVEDVVQASNPFIALFIGILATALLQSSSTTTTLIVAAVVAYSEPNGAGIEMQIAIYMIMGANIGTSVTSTIVSLGYIGNRGEYRKAIAAATAHDFYNIITVVVVFLLEYFFGFLSKGASEMASWFATQPGGISPIQGALDYTSRDWARKLIALTSMDNYTNGNPYIVIPASLFILFASLQLLTQSLERFLIGERKERLVRLVFGRPIRSLFSGIVVTTALQSSSVTSSLIVPLVASNKVSLVKAFPFLLGANIGTTTTALIAAWVLGPPSLPGLTIALAHFLFNVIGVLLIFPVPQLRMLPIRLARRLGQLTLQSRFYGVAYVVVVFFLIPVVFILLAG